MAHVAFFVVRIVLQRYLHRMAAAFKSKLEGFVAHRSLAGVCPARRPACAFASSGPLEPKLQSLWLAP